MPRARRLINSFYYAGRGFTRAVAEEQNVKIHTGVGLAVLAFGWFCGLSRMEWALILLAIGLVMGMELANSAVERASDLLKPRLDVYVKEIKDLMAAAVFFSALIAGLVGCLVFYPHVLAILKGN